MTVRSYLFAPADDAAKVEAALASGADAVVLDLEDTVALSRKAAARRLLVDILCQPRGCLLYVRVNALDRDTAYDDFHAVVRPGLDGVLLPKSETPQQLAIADWLLAQLERAGGLPIGGVDLLPIVETAAGLSGIDALARGGLARVRRLSFGAGDLTLDLGMRWTRGESELAAFRASFAVASRAGGLEPPVDAVWLDLADEAGLEEATRRGADHGFGGKFCLSPAQVVLVHRTLRPTDEETRAAQRVVAAFRRSEAEGNAAIMVDGRFVDYPIARAAQAVLARGSRDLNAADTPPT